MRIFVTGISGLLGLNIAVQLRGQHAVTGCYYSHPVRLDGVQALELDLTRSQETRAVVEEARPDLVIHTAGLTSVEACEEDQDLGYLLNVAAAKHVAAAADAFGARMVHISTDHLFDGAVPWRTEDDTAVPLNVYASTKLQAEGMVLRACPDALVVRTNFFGWGTPARTSFSDWILASLQSGRELTMFSDVFFTPILINDLIDITMKLVSQEAKGVFNVAGGERLSKYAFALKLAHVFQEQATGIREISVDEFPFKARRPRDMSLSSVKAEGFLGMRMPVVEDGLRRLVSLEAKGYHDALTGAIKAMVPRSGTLRLER